MATNISTISHSGSAGKTTSHGGRRSLFSFHFNTPRARRWLLVQLVTLPNDYEDEPDRAALPSRASEGPQTMGHLIDDFQKTQYWMRPA